MIFLNTIKLTLCATAAIAAPVLALDRLLL